MFRAVLVPDQFRRHSDLVGGYFPYAELFKDILPVALGEPSGGGDVPQRRPDHAVHVGQGQVHLLLGEEVHAFALGEYPPQVAVVVLHVGLLPGSVRVAVEDPRPDALAVDASLDGPGVRELRPVVRQEDREDASEHLEAEQPLKPVEYVDDRLGRVGVPQEGQHGGACVELQRKQELPAPDAEHAVHLDHLRLRVVAHELQELLPAPTLGAPRLHLVGDALLPAGLHLRRVGQVQRAWRLEDARVYVVVQRPLADGEAVGVRGDDVVQRLALSHPPPQAGTSAASAPPR